MAEARIDLDSADCDFVVYCDGRSATINQADYVSLPGVGDAIHAALRLQDLVTLLELEARAADLNADKQEFEVDEVNSTLLVSETLVLAFASVDRTKQAEADRLYTLAVEGFEGACRAIIELVRAHNRVEALDEECVSRAAELVDVLAKAKKKRDKLRERIAALEEEVHATDEMYVQSISDGLGYLDDLAALQKQFDEYELFCDWLAEGHLMTNKGKQGRMNLDEAWLLYTQAGGEDVRSVDTNPVEDDD